MVGAQYCPRRVGDKDCLTGFESRGGDTQFGFDALAFADIFFQGEDGCPQAFLHAGNALDQGL